MLARLLSGILGERKCIHPDTWCSVCGRRPVSFLPLPEYYREKSILYGYKYFGKGEMVSLETYTCSNCGATDRERLCALWIEQQIAKKKFSKGARVIHFAPEAALSKKIRGFVSFEFETADLQMDGVDYKVNMMNLPFVDESYDFFICSHVLEHVESDDQAIKELYRITKHGGCGILISPIVAGLEKTLEDPSITDEAGRWRLFGQNDHVRLYAHDDYVNKIGSHGFLVEQLGEGYFGEKDFRSLGISQTSILYVVRK